MGLQIGYQSGQAQPFEERVYPPSQRHQHSWTLSPPPPHQTPGGGQGGEAASAFALEAGFVFTDHEPVIDAPAQQPQLVLG